MLQFFRRIRRKLIDEGNLRRYIVYASGEIILVMIGILLAVQVNNLYEKRKTRSKQKEYLALIRDEMRSNRANITAEIEKLGSCIDAQKRLLQQIDSLTYNFVEDDFTDDWSASFSGQIRSTIESGALSELKFSGVLKDIRNDSIRSYLASWDGRVSRMRNQEEGLQETRRKCNTFLERNGDFRSVFNRSAYKRLGIDRSQNVRSNRVVLESREFQNLLVISIAQATFLEERTYPEILDDIDWVIDTIQKEL